MIALDKVHAELGWLPETSFPEGLKRTVRWYPDHREQWEQIVSGEYRVFTGIKITKTMAGWLVTKWLLTKWLLTKWLQAVRLYAIMCIDIAAQTVDILDPIFKLWLKEDYF